MQNHTDVHPVEVFAGTTLQTGFVKSLLEDAGIPVFLKDEFVGTLSPWWTDAGGAGAVKILVPETFAEKSKEIVQTYLDNTGTVLQ